MSTLTFPSVTPNRSVFSYDGNAVSHSSWLTGWTQVKAFGGERVSAVLYFDNLTNAKRAQILSWLLKMNGGENQVSMPLFGTQNQGAFGGTPLVAGGSQNGNTLDIDGCSNNITDWGKAGDWFSVNNELKMLTDDADTNGSGETTLTFRPRLRSSPPNNDPIETSAPTGIFVLSGPQTSWSYDLAISGSISSLQIELVEFIS